MKNSLPVTRRGLLKGAALAAAGLPALTQSGAFAAETRPPHPNTDPWRSLKVGIASYTFRKIPLDATLKYIQRLGLRYMSIKDAHLALNSTTEERRAVATKIRDAGITLISCGNITMQNDEAQVRSCFQYAADAGIPTIVCSPHPDSMPILDKMVKEFNIRLAIHNHGPEDKRFPSPHDVWKAVKSFDQRIGFCIDVGHTARAQVNPAEAIRKYRDRLYDLHLKDIDSTDPKGHTVEMGRGVLDEKSILKALLDIKYSHHVGFEFEKDSDDPLAGVAESVGYAKAVVALV